MEVDMVADMEVDRVADKVADKVADMMANMVYWAKVVWCEVYPTRASSKLCEFIFVKEKCVSFFSKGDFT